MKAGVRAASASHSHERGGSKNKLVPQVNESSNRHHSKSASQNSSSSARKMQSTSNKESREKDSSADKSKPKSGSKTKHLKNDHSADGNGMFKSSRAITVATATKMSIDKGTEVMSTRESRARSRASGVYEQRSARDSASSVSASRSRSRSVSSGGSRSRSSSQSSSSYDSDNDSRNSGASSSDDLSSDVNAKEQIRTLLEQGHIFSYELFLSSLSNCKKVALSGLLFQSNASEAGFCWISASGTPKTSSWKSSGQWDGRFGLRAEKDNVRKCQWCANGMYCLHSTLLFLVYYLLVLTLCNCIWFYYK